MCILEDLVKSYDFFENPDLPVSTLREKPLNRDTKKTQKVHSFGQLLCQGLEISFVASLYGVL